MTEGAYKCGGCGELFTDTHECVLFKLPQKPQPQAGMKFDAGKPRWDLMPPIAEKAVVDVLTYGAGKYAPENWRKVEGWRWRYARAARGHIWSWLMGEWLDNGNGKDDKGSGLPHLAHAICCLMFLLELETERREKK